MNRHGTIAKVPNPFIADLHIHSKYSRACSRDCDIENLTWWARRKGIGLVGTGDFTHPAWNAHLHDVLVPAEPGLYRLNDELQGTIDNRTPKTCRTPVRFMLSVEISTIYKRDDQTRKVHHLVYLPDLDAVARFNKTLGAIGNLGSDGRPILGLDSRDLLEITLESSPDGYLIPAHIWTPWFAALGSKSGFDAIADCYADLADHIFAVETGLSSDPEMNWRVSSLDSYTLVSNSDAHSPPILGREATIFHADLDYFAIRNALQAGDGSVGTIEFFPEEGKYHLDGHRACGVRWEPTETKARDTRCGCCGKPVTVGVQHRVDDLADRAPGVRRPDAAEFHSLVPLPEIIGELRGRGPKTKTVLREIDKLVGTLEPELEILRNTPLDDVTRVGGSDLAEALRRLREGTVIRESGYDGEYGVIRLFTDDEIAELRSGSALFSGELFALPKPTPEASLGSTIHRADFPEIDPNIPAGHPDYRETGPQSPSPALGLDSEQTAAVRAPLGPLLIVAGPGTGKTRTLTHRIAYLVAERGVPAEQILAVTFTRRAAGELTERLAALVPGQAQPTVGTFHALCLSIVREQPALVGLSNEFQIADSDELRAVLAEFDPGGKPNRNPVIPDEHRSAVSKALRAADRIALDELATTTVELLEIRPDLAEQYRKRWPHIFVDEYQDVDETQYRLLRLLAPEWTNLCVIGDPDQAIYSFRGADVGFFLRFTEDYPGAETVRLHRNYRSAAPIVAAAVRVLTVGDQSTDRPPSLTATRPGADLIGWTATVSARHEAEGVARSIDELLGGVSFHSLDTGTVDGRTEQRAAFSLGDIAVLYRSGAQAGPVMQALTKAGIPFQRHSHDPFAHRPGINEVLRAMRFSSERLVEGSASVADRLTAAARTVERQLSTERAETASLRSGDVWSAVEALATVAYDCGADTEGFYARVATGVGVDGFDPRADAVTLLTLHASKGLEFDVVFIVGCVDGTLPLRYGSIDEAALAEERRLFFVGTTRARELLFLSGAVQGGMGGMATDERRRSPFVDAIGPDLLLTGEASPRKPRPDQQLRLL